MNFVKSEREIWNGSKVVVYSLGDFKISASRQGVSLDGNSPMFESEDELDMLARYVGMAWQHFQAMRGENGISVEQEQRTGDAS